MNSFLSWLLGTGSHLSALEKRLLNAVRAQLAPGLTQTWDRQVQAITKVQRLPEGVEVNFYRLVKGRPTFDEDLAFANKAKELLLASLTVSLGKASSELEARVWCVNGFLFSIEYTGGGVAYFEEAAGMDPPPDFSILCDLRADLSVATAAPAV